MQQYQFLYLFDLKEIQCSYFVLTLCYYGLVFIFIDILPEILNFVFLSTQTIMPKIRKFTTTIEQEKLLQVFLRSTVLKYFSLETCSVVRMMNSERKN